MSIVNIYIKSDIFNGPFVYTKVCYHRTIIIYSGEGDTNIPRNHHKKGFKIHLKDEIIHLKLESILIMYISVRSMYMYEVPSWIWKCWILHVTVNLDLGLAFMLNDLEGTIDDIKCHRVINGIKIDQIIL